MIPDGKEKRVLSSMKNKLEKKEEIPLKDTKRLGLTDWANPNHIVYLS